MEAGAYRKEPLISSLPTEVSSLIQGGYRLAKTNQPIIGATQRPDLAGLFAAGFERSPKEGAEYYASQLRSGSIVPILPHPASGKVWQPGELFFNS